MLKQCLLVLAVLVGSVQAMAQAFPTKPVHIVLPFPPGGLTDNFMRGMAQELSAQWKQPVLIENKPGANTAIAAQAVARAPADGYTLMFATDATISYNHFLYRSLPYDPVKDFEPIANLVSTYSLIVVRADSPIRTLADLVAEAKKMSGRMTYGSFGNGSTAHMDSEAFARTAGILLTHVPYKGITEVLPAVMAGQVDFAFAGISPALPLVKGGKLRGVAIAAPQRSALLPDVPTFAESGVQGFESSSWFGLFAPAGTPRETLETIASAAETTMRSTGFREKYVDSVGLIGTVMPSRSFSEFIAKDRASYRKKISSMNLTLD